MKNQLKPTIITKPRMLLIALAALGLLAACKGKSGGGDYELINNHQSSTSSADSFGQILAPLIARLVETAEMEF